MASGEHSDRSRAAMLLKSIDFAESMGEPSPVGAGVHRLILSTRGL